MWTHKPKLGKCSSWLAARHPPRSQPGGALACYHWSGKTFYNQTTDNEVLAAPRTKPKIDLCFLQFKGSLSKSDSQKLVNLSERTFPQISMFKKKVEAVTFGHSRTWLLHIQTPDSASCEFCSFPISAYYSIRSVMSLKRAACTSHTESRCFFWAFVRFERSFVSVRKRRNGSLSIFKHFSQYSVSRPCSRRIGPNFRHLQLTNLMVSTNRDSRLLASCESWSDCGDDDHPVCLSFRAIPPDSKSVRKQEACQSSRNNSCCVSCLRNRSICASGHGLGSQLLPRLGSRWSNGWCPATRSWSSLLFLWPGPPAG